ncbi:MAG: alpha/beta fold hydrolase [Alphaproteobacteria bacterium]
MRRSIKVEFPGAFGDMLAARLEMPDGPPRAYALFAHCFTCSMDVFAAARIAVALAERGIAVLRFDFTGLGTSAGEFANTNFSSNVQDVLCAADFLRREYRAPDLLIGHSFGGAAVLAAAGEVAEAKAVATIGAPADPGHVRHLFTETRAEIEANGEAEVDISGRRFRVRKQFLEDVEGHRLADRIATLRKALLVFHAPLDDTVGAENAGAIMAAAKQPKSFVSLDGADHLLSRHEDSLYIADMLSAWATRYVAPPAELREAPDAVDQGEVFVTEAGDGRFRQEIMAGPHRLIADEPPAMGGNGDGPSPYGFLLAGLGACTAMTVRLYAERKGWPLDRVAVRLRHAKAHAEDCAGCEAEDAKLDRIEKTLTLTGALTAEQHARLLEIAEKCPVNRTLQAGVRTRIRATE